MTVCIVIATKPILARQLSVKKYYTEFYENPTNNLVADIELQKIEGQTDKCT
jgi:hypothetical protein